MNKAIAAKAKATKKAKAEHFANQKIEIDENWSVERFDQLNWEVRHKGKFYGFFPSPLNAFQALPAKMLGEAAKNSIAQVQQSQKAIQEKIEQAFSRLSFAV